MKWYNKILLVFLIILMSPLVVLALICFWISRPFVAIYDRHAYKKSQYFKEFRVPYSKMIFNSNSFIFYNYATNEGLAIKYVRQKNSFEYFVFENQAFIFPDFSTIEYNTEKQYWEVVYIKNDKELYRLSLDEWLDKQTQLFDKKIDLPIKVLISRNYFEEEFLDIDSLPSSIYVIKNYYSAFKDENRELLSFLPKSTKVLYEMMRKNEKLGGKFELKDDEQLIVWTFEDVIYEIEINKIEGFFGVLKNNKSRSEITHWHPDCNEIYDDICNIGEKGNLLIIESCLGSSRILYIGKVENCTYNRRKKHLGKIYYFESK